MPVEPPFPQVPVRVSIPAPSPGRPAPTVITGEDEDDKNAHG